jgi:rubrerythrin
VTLKSLDEFLSYAVKVEEDAAIHFERLASAMEACGNRDVAGLFSQLGGYSRLHLQEAKAKSAAHNAVLKLPANSAWPDQETPERTALWAGHPSLSRLDALKAALQGERRGFEFYYAVAGTTTDAQIREIAREFVKEETEHVDTLKEWIVREESSLRASTSTVR